GQHIPHIGAGGRQTGEDLRELAVVEAEGALEDGGEDHTVVGGDREVAALIELRGRETGPIAVDAAADDAAPQYPDDVAVAVIGAAIAILPNRPAEFGKDNDDSVVPGAAETAGEKGE